MCASRFCVFEQVNLVPLLDAFSTAPQFRYNHFATNETFREESAMRDKESLLEDAATFEQEDSQQPVPPTDIFAYNELRSCADLYRMHATGKLEIQPDFQRDVVWKQDDQSRFIDSLVKQLPIPSMCFSLDHRTQRWKVIDGLQRMSSIIKFLSENPWRLSNLSDIHPQLRSVSNKELKQGSEEQARLFALVEDVSIPITVIRCDYTQKSHMLYLFTIFHRLNSGGVRLTNQEIRNCIYTGFFNDALKDFDKNNVAWRSVKKRIWGSMDRFRSIEVLLRVLAFSDERASYDGNLARFLNEYMHKKSTNSAINASELQARLGLVATQAQSALDVEKQKKLPLLFVEALLVALDVHRASLPSRALSELHVAYTKMRGSAAFADSARYAVSSAENVKTRLDAAIAAIGS